MANIYANRGQMPYAARYPSNGLQGRKEEGESEKAHYEKKVRCIIGAAVFLIGTLVVCSVVGLVTVKNNASTTSPGSQVTLSFPGEATILGLFTDEMATKGSPDFRTVESEFCGKMDILMRKSVGDRYLGCEVTSIRSGSLIVEFKLSMKPSAKDDASATQDFIKASMQSNLGALDATKVSIEPAITLTDGIQENVDYPGEATIEGTFNDEMNNKDSFAFKQVEKEFCGKMDILMQQSALSTQYNGCKVTSIRKGSLIVKFKLSMKLSNKDDTSTTQVQIKVTLQSKKGDLDAIKVSVEQAVAQTDVTGNCASSPCTNGGTCINVPSGFFCKCEPGFLGDTCATQDFCAKNPCQNNGTCFRTAEGFDCSCKENWKGEKCDEATCDRGFTGTPCQECPVGSYKSDEGTADCTPCPEGSTTAIIGAILEQLCSLCLEGYGSGPNGCAKCLKGTYKNTTGNLPCTDCASGTFSEKKGQTSCDLCPAGFFSKETGQVECTPCRAGTYSALSGQSKCTLCGSGTANKAEKQIKCEPCLAGTYSKEGQQTCTSCEAGTYNDEKGQSDCKNCSDGQVSASGSTGCTDCLAGTYSKGRQEICSLCEAGTKNVKVKQPSCSPCDPGTALSDEGQTRCDPCTPGTFANETGQKVCTNCEDGTYNTESKAKSCIKCAAGKSTNGGRTTCTDCPAGTFSKGGQLDCTKCEAGTSNDRLGQDKCTNCTSGKISSEGVQSCSICPTGEYSNDDKTQCLKCPKGTANNQNEQEKCTPCKAGTSNNDIGKTSCTPCPDGMYANDTGSTECKPCPYTVTNQKTACECTASSGVYCSPPGWDAGEPNVYFSFETDSGYEAVSEKIIPGVFGNGVELEDSASLEIKNLTSCYTEQGGCMNGVTITFWVNITEGKPNYILTTKAMTTNGSAIQFDEDGVLRYLTEFGNWSSEHEFYFNHYNEWIHIAMVQNDNNVDIYVDGQRLNVKGSTPPIEEPFTATTDLAFGKSLVNETTMAEGSIMIDEFCIWDKTLSQSQIQAIYNEYKNEVAVLNNG